jgi:hypothetical protein
MEDWKLNGAVLEQVHLYDIGFAPHITIYNNCCPRVKVPCADVIVVV